MPDLPSSIRIMEVGPRDGLQIESRIPSVEQKVELVDRLVAAGLEAIEVGSFVNPKAVPQMADTDAVFKSLPDYGAEVELHGLWLNARGLSQALDNGRVTVTGKLILTASDTFSLRNTNKDIARTLAAFPDWIGLYRAAGIPADELHIPAAYGCNYEGEVPAEKVIGLIARATAILEGAGERLRNLSLSDTMGWGNPVQTQRLVGGILERWPHLNVKMHLHDTRGTALANAAAALQLGVREFDSSIGGLGGCPFAANRGVAGNVCTEDLAFMCEEMGIDTGTDLELLIEAAAYAERIVGHELPGKLMKSGTLARYRTER